MPTVSIVRLAVCIALVAAPGCGSPKPAPSAPPAPQSAATPLGNGQPGAGAPAAKPPQSPLEVSQSSADSSKASASASPSTASPPSAQPSAVTGLRDFAARYLESDGAGGWRTNEQAALELEKRDADAAFGLLPLLADSQVEVRRGAAFFLLGSFNPSEPAQVQAFCALLGDSDRTIRGIALSAARQMRPDDQAAAVPRLAAMLDAGREDKPANRESAARLLATLKTSAGEATDALAAAASGDPVSSVRSVCLIALAQVAEPATAAPLVAKGLTDQEAAVRLVAAVRLRQLGAGSAPASKRLALAMADSDSRVRAAAAETLVKIGQPAVGDIVAQLTTDRLEARKLALYCLTKIGPPAKDAAPQVEKCLDDADTEVQKLAAAALASLRGK